jgi:hypothetical protein
MFKKGADWNGNAKGRPKKGLCLADKLQHRDKTKLPDGRTNEDAYLDQLYSIARGEGKVHPMEVLAAINFIVERQYGKALERIERSTEDEGDVSAETLEMLTKLVKERDERINRKKDDIPPQPA